MLLEAPAYGLRPSEASEAVPGQERQTPPDDVAWDAADTPTSLTLRELVCTACSEAHAVLGEFDMLLRGSPGETFRPAWSIRLRTIIPSASLTPPRELSLPYYRATSTLSGWTNLLRKHG